MSAPRGQHPGPSPGETAREAAAGAARDCYGRLLALLASTTGDIATAEDALADAFERALATWPGDGTPRSPEGWLLTVARNRLKDHWKSAATRTSVPLEPARHDGVHLDDIDPDAVGDHRLELMLVCAHPAIDRAIRMPLMLNTVLGHTAAQIAGAMAVPSTTLAARLVRAKRRIKDARIPFTIPDANVLPQRIAHVLEAVYGAHVIDWPIGGTRERHDLSREALQLAETLADLLPRDGEVRALAALICLSSARRAARLDGAGHLVPLAEQDPRLWDEGLIARGHEHLRAAHASRTLGRFSLEAAIQAVHCARRDTGATDWRALRDLHRSLCTLAPTLGSRTALAAVTAECDGPEAGLALLDELGGDAARFQPAWATRAHLLERAGCTAEAALAYEKAISLTTDAPERAHLERRRSLLTNEGSAPREATSRHTDRVGGP